MKKVIALVVLNIGLVLSTSFAYAKLTSTDQVTRATDEVVMVKDAPVSIAPQGHVKVAQKPAMTPKSAPVVQKKVTTKVWSCDTVQMYAGRGSSVKICGMN